jgi:TetR/AcrR family transcriptional regulator of autoinduction and epiphytic fitness
LSLQDYRDARAREKRADILSAASRLFAERGFAQVSTAALAEEAAVSTATLYRYFADKESLFVAVIDALVSDVIQQMADLPRASEDRLRELAFRYANLLCDPIVVGLIRSVVADQQGTSAFRDSLESHGNEIFANEFDVEIRALLTAHDSDELHLAHQASIELRGALEHVTLLPELLFHEHPGEEELHTVVEQTLDSWRKRWLGEKGFAEGRTKQAV